MSSKASQEMSCLKGLVQLSMPSRTFQDLRCLEEKDTAELTNQAKHRFQGMSCLKRPVKLRQCAVHPKTWLPMGPTELHAYSKASQEASCPKGPAELSITSKASQEPCC